jgi:hypothetical protein
MHILLIKSKRKKKSWTQVLVTLFYRVSNLGRTMLRLAQPFIILSRKCMQFSVGFLGRITVRGVSTALLQLLPFERCVRTNAQNM